MEVESHGPPVLPEPGVGPLVSQNNVPAVAAGRWRAAEARMVPRKRLGRERSRFFFLAAKGWLEG